MYVAKNGAARRCQFLTVTCNRGIKGVGNPMKFLRAIFQNFDFAVASCEHQSFYPTTDCFGGAALAAGFARHCRASAFDRFINRMDLKSAYAYRMHLGPCAVSPSGRACCSGCTTTGSRCCFADDRRRRAARSDECQHGRSSDDCQAKRLDVVHVIPPSALSPRAGLTAVLETGTARRYLFRYLKRTYQVFNGLSRSYEY